MVLILKMCWLIKSEEVEPSDNAYHEQTYKTHYPTDTRYRCDGSVWRRRLGCTVTSAYTYANADADKSYEPGSRANARANADTGTDSRATARCYRLQGRPVGCRSQYS